MAAQPEILLAAALPSEFAALERSRPDFPGPVSLIELGIGRRGVEKNLRTQLREQPPDLLILFGTAAWIREDKNYHPGQTFLIENAVYSPRRIEDRTGITYYPTWQEKSALASRLARECGIPLNQIFTLDSPLLDDDRRKMLLAIIDAYHHAQVDLVDMETWHALNLAQKMKIPALVLRSLTDFAGSAAQEQFEANLDHALTNGVAQLVKMLAALDADFACFVARDSS